jgi:hypothetical protein
MRDLKPEFSDDLVPFKLNTKTLVLAGLTLIGLGALMMLRLIPDRGFGS